MNRVGKSGFTANKSVQQGQYSSVCGDAADCGRQYLDLKTKKALGLYKNRYACVLGTQICDCMENESGRIRSRIIWSAPSAEMAVIPYCSMYKKKFAVACFFLYIIFDWFTCPLRE